MPSYCAVFSCTNNAAKTKAVRYFRFPSVYGPNRKVCPLRSERLSKWIKALKRKNFTHSMSKYARICSNHFQSGEPSKLHEKDHPDWVPNINMGYRKHIIPKSSDRFERAKNRLKFESKVVSCEKIQSTGDQDSPNHSAEYEVILEDTILFPEGGGQPCDHGYLNSIPVSKVIRRIDKAVHITKEPLSVGDEVKQCIDWPRRFDHMQQHSGQHLITAIIDRDFKFPTLSWWLGEDVSYIELDTPQITDAQINEAEDTINGLIRNGNEVSVEVYPEDTTQEELDKVRARGLPEDHKGDIRIINIEGVDRNMCCGTHVSNLSQLQIVKLLHSEKSKRKNKVLLYFLVGNRVLRRLAGCIEREQKLTTLLKNNPSSHPELVDKLQKNVKILNKNVQSVLKDFAILVATQLNDTLPVPAFFSMHRKEAEPGFMDTFIRELGGREDILLFLSVGNEKTIGNILLYGPEKAVADLGPRICELLDGKGAGKGNRFQARVFKMENRLKALSIIQEYFKEEN